MDTSTALAAAQSVMLRSILIGVAFPAGCSKSSSLGNLFNMMRYRPFKRNDMLISTSVVTLVLIFLMSTTLYGYALPHHTFLPAGQTRDSYIDINGNTIHYTKAGHGPPLVLIHGFGAWSFSWRHNIGPLSKRYTVYTIDLLGFGLSNKPSNGPYSVAAQADLVSSFIKKLGLGKVTLIGNSLGGEIAIKETVTHPNEVSSLVLIDSTGFRRNPSIPGWVPKALLGAYLRVYLLNRPHVEHILKNVYFNDYLIDNYTIDGYYLPITTQGTEDALIAMSKQLRIGLKKEYIRQVSVPTLIIWGKHDIIVSVVDAYKLEDAINGSKAVIIDDAGHAPQEETPELVNSLIMDFLKNPSL